MFIQSIFYLILSLFFILSRSNYNFGFESSLIEILQILILLSCILITIIKKNILLYHSNKIVYFSKLLFFLFFLYEEISFLTEGLGTYFNSINSQEEINFHRLFILYNIFITIKFPILDYVINVSYRMFIYTLGLFIIGYGSYLPFLKEYKLIFFEREISPFTFVYVINLFFISVNNQLFNGPKLLYMDSELLELFIYILFIFDLAFKINRFRKNSENKNSITKVF